VDGEDFVEHVKQNHLNNEVVLKKFARGRQLFGERRGGHPVTPPPRL